MALSPQVVKRIAFIRFLYAQGMEQAARPQPLASTALLSFHDAVEMFLLLSAEHLGVALSRGVNFDGYFTEIKNGANLELPARPALRRMNNSRVNFKHHGSIPSTTDLEQFRADVTTFFTDASQLVFGVDFASVDMVDLVTQQGAVEKLRDAEKCAKHSDYVEALALLSEAFDELLEDYSNRKRSSIGSFPYKWWPPEGYEGFPYTSGLNSHDHDAQLVQWTEKIVDQTDQISDTLITMQRTMRVLAMGLDYRRYARFELLIPMIVRFADGRRQVHTTSGLEINDDEYKFCRQFVIESALHLAEMDFDLDVHAIQQEHDRRKREAPQSEESTAPATTPHDAFRETGS